MAEPAIYSQTQRIVLLIDLHPLVHLQNPNPYLTSILTAARTLLLFPPLSSSLFAFKLFFSSLSPLLSSSSVHRLLHKPSAASLSFNHWHETLTALSDILNSLSTPLISAEFANSLPRAVHVSGSLLQLVHDYAWEQQNESENLPGTLSNFPTVRSNLVLLFSANVSEFMNEDEDGKLLTNVDSLCNKVCEIFGNVNDAYVSRDIHCSWIDVKLDLEYDREKVETDDCLLQLGFLKSGIRSLGWGFCSTDSIILGSALIPFELIYPIFGISSNCLKFPDLCKSIRAQLSLEISDVGGKPLECKCCDLELFYLMKPPTMMVADVMSSLELRNSENESLEQDKRIWGPFDCGIANLRIKAVQKCNEDGKSEGCLSNLILVRGHSRESRKSSNKCSSGFFADKVLDVISSEIGEFTCRKNTPIWQLLLSFLCRNKYRALVCLSSEKGDSLMAILMPFSVHLALLSIVNNGHLMETEYLMANFTKVDGEISKPCANSGSVGSQSETLPSRNVSLVDQNRCRNQKHVYKDLTWISFHKAAYEYTALELEEAYFASKFSNSKMLKFLKCWMKQIKKSNNGSFPIQDGAESCQHIEREIDDRLNGTDLESQQPIASYFPTELSKIQDEAASVSYSETSETFFSYLPKKIQVGLESKGVDLQVLAERLVNLSIYWLYRKNDTANSIESGASTAKPDGLHGNMVAIHLMKVLLKNPQKLKDKQKDNGPSFSASDPGFTSSASENIVREHELQILLRMEILRSNIAESIEASTKRKLVKQICLLLEIIQYLVEGGFHGHLSLYDYVEKTIKSRYDQVIGDVVNKIYARMDLLPYVDENDTPILLLNSEDSNHSWRDRGRHETTEINRICESISAEDASSQNDVHNPQDINKKEHARKVSEAQERRERARRCVSFTTWVPDLQRVWAPKLAKGLPAKSESGRKQSKRKERSKRKDDVVCETPMFEKKHDGSDHFVSVSKALFQDD